MITATIFGILLEVSPEHLEGLFNAIETSMEVES